MGEREDLIERYKQANLKRVKYGFLSAICFPVGFHLILIISHILDIDLLFPILFFIVLPVSQITFIALWFSYHVDQNDLEARIKIKSK
jgi:uncharacterized membrane protein